MDSQPMDHAAAAPRRAQARPWFELLLPGSMVVRVLALYTLAWMLCVGSLSYFFFRHEVRQQVEYMQENALVTMEITAQTVSDSAVIGDYDTILRTLDLATMRDHLLEVQFIDLGGGRISSVRTRGLRYALAAPGWLVASISIMESRVAASTAGSPVLTSVPPLRSIVMPMTSRSSSRTAISPAYLESQNTS